MRSIWPKKLPDKIALILFACYIVIGLSIVGDYGVNWDDKAQRLNGLNNIEYLFHHNKEPLRQSVDRYHGPAFEIVLIFLEKTLYLRDPHHIYLMRHTAVFIYMLFCIMAFYFLIRKLFEYPWLPLLGCLIFITHPRIFADTFYNPKDITEMGGLMVGMLTMILFSEKLTWKYLLLHAFISAWCIDIRVIGAILPLATIGILIYKKLFDSKFSQRELIFKICCYSILTLILMIPMWPILMDGLFHQLACAIDQMSNYNEWDKTNTYFGQEYEGTKTPGPYQFVWFFMTTPVIYSLLFLTGFGFLVRNLFRGLNNFTSDIFIWMSLAFFITPPAAMWFHHSVVLEGWRHVFMIYPFFVLVCVFALDRLMAQGALIWRPTLATLVASILFNVGMLGYLHPFEFIYFNPLAVKYLGPLDRNFEIDYWGASFKQGLEYLLKKQYRGKAIKVSVSNRPGIYNYDFLPEADKNKIVITGPEDADFHISAHRWDWAPQPDEKLVFEFKRQGNRIMSIYKLR